MKPDTIAMISLFRSKARLWENAAIALENAAKAEGMTTSESPFPLGVVTADIIRESIADKSKRVAEIALELSVSRRDVEKIVEDPANGFVIGGRGWIKRNDHDRT